MAYSARQFDVGTTDDVCVRLVCVIQAARASSAVSGIAVSASLALAKANVGYIAGSL